MTNIEEIEKLLKENTLRIRTVMTHEETLRSKGDIEKYYEKKMAVDIGNKAYETDRIEFLQSYDEDTKTIQASCVVLHPETVEKIMKLLKG